MIIAAFIFAFLSFCLSTYLFIDKMADLKSSHTVQFMPAEELMKEQMDLAKKLKDNKNDLIDMSSPEEDLIV